MPVISKWVFRGVAESWRVISSNFMSLQKGFRNASLGDFESRCRLENFIIILSWIYKLLIVNVFGKILLVKFILDVVGLLRSFRWCFWRIRKVDITRLEKHWLFLLPALFHSWVSAYVFFHYLILIVFDLVLKHFCRLNVLGSDSSMSSFFEGFLLIF